MIIGHAGFALLAKRARPTVSLAVLVVAAYGADIVEMAFRAVHNYNRMLSHSLVSIGIMATVTAVTYLVATHKWGDAAVVWAMYVSHWPADFITGVKPTWPGGPELGLMFYDHPYEEAFFELLLVTVCFLVYWRGRPRRTVTSSVT